MRVTLTTTIAALALLGACNRRDDTGARTDNDRRGLDTVYQSQTVRDTTVIRADTNIDVDTVKKTDHIDDQKH